MRAADDDFLARIAAAQTTLTPKAARVAEFIGQDYVRAAFMTTREIADVAGVSRATVERFLTALGYASYDAFRAALQDRVNFDLSAVEHLRMTPDDSRTVGALLQRIIDRDVASLQDLARSVSEEDLDRFIEAILAAERITIVGVRFVGPLAEYFRYSLRKILPNVQAFLHADSALYDDLRLMGERDLLIALAFARYSAELVELLRYARRRGLRVLAITDAPISPVVPVAELTLFARGGRLDFVGSLAAPAALINCIVSEVGVRREERAIERLQMLEESAEASGAFVHAGAAGRPPDRGFIAWPDESPAAHQRRPPRGRARR